MSDSVEEAKKWAEAASHWDDHPEHPVQDWRTEVANNETRQSYKEWVVHKVWVIANG
jgi:hypothetical protein